MTTTESNNTQIKTGETPEAEVSQMAAIYAKCKRGDVSALARKAGLSTETVTKYLKDQGTLRHIEKSIITAARKMFPELYTK